MQQNKKAKGVRAGLGRTRYLMLVNFAVPCTALAHVPIPSLFEASIGASLARHSLDPPQFCIFSRPFFLLSIFLNRFFQLPFLYPISHTH